MRLMKGFEARGEQGKRSKLSRSLTGLYPQEHDQSETSSPDSGDLVAHARPEKEKNTYRLAQSQIGHPHEIFSQLLSSASCRPSGLAILTYLDRIPFRLHKLACLPARPNRSGLSPLRLRSLTHFLADSLSSKTNQEPSSRQTSASRLRQWLICYTHAQGEQCSPGPDGPPRVRFSIDKKKKLFTLDWFEKRIGPFLPSPDDLGIPPITGRQGQSLEGAGKRRIFAMGNHMNQRLLKPIHEWIARVLRLIPMDGTFDQTRQVKRKGSRKTFCYDLSAATDRWPLVVLFEVFQNLFDRSFASAVVNSALACNIFEVPFSRRRQSSVSFVTGQPLGYYASWPLFALSHHLWCGMRPRGYIQDKSSTVTLYSVMIFSLLSPTVCQILYDLGVSISWSKSLISESGCMEFAKRGRWGEKDFSLSLSVAYRITTIRMALWRYT
ncbi:UNVERIFIED_CONTAM: putative mitochondrial protein [Sesamum calycinum]|uniref:Mitochondrial protein n=1 Tax=Sesamum calycinum TaxID=2727403 RepID=A0AAW2JMZ2_9LAMI